MKNNYVAIGGCPRSGTTALTDLLNCDPRVFIGREFHIFDRWNRPIYTRVLGKKLSPGSKVREAMIKKGLDIPDISSMTGKDFMHSLKSKTDFRVYGDKVPRNYLYSATELARKFPGMKFIFCLRDGRDVISSQIRLWNKGVKKDFTAKDVETAQHLWLSASKQLIDTYRVLGPEKVFICTYEIAVISPESMAERIGMFLGLKKLSTNNHRYKSIHLQAWKTEQPGIMKGLNNEFIKHLIHWGYA